MRHGVLILPEHRWSRARDLWEKADRLGYEHAWTYDHLMWRWLRDKPWFPALPTLTAAAMVTSRIRLGPLVASPNFRSPVEFAKELMALDDISGGRIICGVGAGAEGFDTRIRGDHPLLPVERAARFGEFVELLDQLLRQSFTEYCGDWFTAAGVRMEPGFVQRPRVPLAIAGSGPKGMALAVRHAEIWVTTGVPGRGSPERYEQLLPFLKVHLQEVDNACAAAGRDPASLRRLLVAGVSAGGVLDSVESYRDASGLFQEIGITDLVVPWPRAEFPYQAREEVLEEFAATELEGSRKNGENECTR
ncbi:LLM class flavin-dependent oxidoreductase [Streptosporangium sp. NBC_01469]|uniref:LLM class flavin-dependent oxidoreductase n=1 Tax=Streptosporangium sp. NBC_01469 TaxID=2903898 RepID=UPI002E2912A4|nr:LLM class flavin-dependent oxidoreductase [Streptosporangium sp. NBC_01469]